MTQGGYRAFISYTRTDYKTAVALHRQLERYVIPRAFRQKGDGRTFQRRPIRPVFLDEAELVPGSDLSGRITEALARTAFLIVVCSPAARNSKWVAMEIDQFLTTHSRDHILAVVVDGEPNAQARDFSAELESFPLSLFDPGSSDLEQRAEPLWIDWRPNQVSRTSFLRVIAATLQLNSLDELIQRDAKAEFQKKLLRVFGFTFIGMMALILWYISLASASIQTIRFDAWFKGFIKSQADRDIVSRDDPAYTAAYSIEIIDDFNNDGILDVFAVDETVANSGSGGRSTFFAIGNVVGGFSHIRGYYQSPWQAYAIDTGKKWKSIQYAMPQDGLIIVHDYVPMTEDYKRVMFFACSSASIACQNDGVVDKGSIFCALDEGGDWKIASGAPVFTFKRSASVLEFSEENLEADTREHNSDLFAAAISADSRWVIAMHRRDEGASFVPATYVTGAPLRRSEHCRTSTKR